MNRLPNFGGIFDLSRMTAELQELEAKMSQPDFWSDARAAAGGAEFLVTITNDAWFGDSSAPSQHFSMVVFRSVENHLAFARAANTGISGFIDPFGRIIQTSPLFTQTALQAEIPVRQTKTFYSRHGDVFAYGCMLISLLFCLYGFFGTKGAEPDAVAATPI